MKISSAESVAQWLIRFSVKVLNLAVAFFLISQRENFSTDELGPKRSHVDKWIYCLRSMRR